MKVILDTKLGHMSIPDATSIQFNQDEVLIFTPTNGYTKLREIDIHNITFIADETCFRQREPGFNRLDLLKRIRAHTGCTVAEAISKMREMLGD